MSPLPDKGVMPTSCPNPGEAQAAVRMPPIVKVAGTNIPTALEDAEAWSRPSPGDSQPLTDCNAKVGEVIEEKKGEERVFLHYREKDTQLD